MSTIRTISVKRIIAIPKFRKETLYSKTKLFIIGWMIARFQMSMNICSICISVGRFAYRLIQSVYRSLTVFYAASLNWVVLIGLMHPLFVRVAVCLDSQSAYGLVFRAQKDDIFLHRKR